jgi:putative PIN family toxin of toxin-antitoxin system
MRVFLDTNVLASAAATRGLCSDVLREVFASHELVISEYLIKELKRVLADKFNLPRDIREDYIWLLHQDTIVAEEFDPPSIQLKDESDIPILGAALQAKADVLITGDLELQNLEKIGKLLILTPRGFWERLRAQNEAPADNQ